MMHRITIFDKNDLTGIEFIRFLGIIYSVGTVSPPALEFIIKLADGKTGRASWPLGATQMEYQAEMKFSEVEILERQFDKASKLIGRREWEYIATRYNIDPRGVLLRPGRDVCLIRQLQQTKFRLEMAR